MDDRLLKTCKREFERGVERFADMLFENRHGRNAFAACLEQRPDCCLELLELAARAVRARMWFARHAPCRYQPLPLVYYDEQEKIFCSSDFHRHLTVYYSYSLRGQGFNYVKHPGFYQYGRGLLADPDCPIDLRDDQELLAEFPPKPLPGLDGILWHPVPTRAGVSF